MYPVQRRSGEGLAVTGIVMGVFALIGVVFALVMAGRAVVLVNRGSSVEAAATPVPVTLSELRIDPGMISAPLGSTLTVTNDGAAPHTLAIKGTTLATPDIASGKSANLDLSSLDEGEYTVICTIPGHEAAGMTAMLNIVTAGSTVAAPSSGTPGPMSAEDMDATMAARTAAFPARTSGVGAVDLAPTVLPDGTKEFHLTASVFSWEVEPGKTVEAWGYNRMVPGPTIRVGVGDKVRVVLKNALPESTVIHWHGLYVPNDMDGVPDITQEPIKPGGTFTYSFTAREAQVAMYHSHHNATKQVTNGLLGAFYVGSMPLPAGTPKLAVDVPMVLNDAGTIGYSLNGKSFPATAPIVASRGDWIKIDYMNEGLQIHPMHLHGMPQLVIAKDGYPRTPQLEDTVVVAPGERVSVLVHATEPGTWAWHCHILNHAEREDGMFGMVTALVVK